jgi:UDP-N-acetyl-D-galactosamine dehydrogenase
LLMLGITFKENCPDVRNTKIVDVIKALEDYGIQVTIYDPWANPAEVCHEYGLTTVNQRPNVTFDAIVLGVAHAEFIDLDINSLRNACSILYDVKGVLVDGVDGKL